MKYESELIKEIVDSRGHGKSSLHYESECVKTWIEEAKGAYPKLCDYESEWLNYISILDDKGGSEEPPIGEFPYLSVTDVTEATVDNVVPYAYKSAILKGNTLVNLQEKGTWSISNDIAYYKPRYKASVLKTNTKYIIYFTNLPSTAITCYFDGGKNNRKDILDNRYSIFTTGTDISRDYYIHIYTITGGSFTTEELANCHVMIIEYQDGMENWDIPYFEGMQSVKIPVLTTTGKNLFDGKLEYGLLNNKTGLPMNSNDFIRSQNFIPINCKTITFTVINGECGLSFCYYDKDKNFIDSKIKAKVSDDLSIPDGVAYLKFRTYPISGESITNNLNTQIQIEEGSVATTYEPYQSNILTVNEDVTLRSNESVCDELDLLTGRLTQRIGENNEVLAQEVVKTVDLTVVNQDGESMSKIKPIEGTIHLSTSGDTIPPLFSGEIPVEAITQNLASFIDMETEE